MNSILKIVGIIAVLTVIGAIFATAIAISTYNGFKNKDIDAKKAWSNVETQYQRRADLIPKMVKIAETSMKFQLKLSTEYAQAREGFDASEKAYREAMANAKDPESIAKADQAWQNVKDNWKNVGMTINARSESVTKADLTQMTELNDEMSGIENVIAGKREAYTNAVSDYNRMVQTFPSSWFANYWGFKEKQPFAAQKGAENMPNVDMNISI